MKILPLLYFITSASVIAADERLPERTIHPANYLEHAGSVGVTVLPDTGGLRVTRVLAGGPAEAAGVKPEDRILEIDGKKLADLDAKDRIELLRGKVGTKVTLFLQRAQPVQEVRVTLVRAPLAQWLSPKP